MCYRRCPQRRFLEYHFNDKGVVPDRIAIPLGTGGAIHLGLQRLLEGASPDEAVQDAIAKYKEEVAAAGFQDTRNEHQDYTIKEQLALTEVMIRAWALKRLPLVQQNYNTIEVEKESAPTELAPGIWLFRRPDGVLENKVTGYYEVLSFKTAKYYGKKNENNNIIDDQGISETWAVAQKYGDHKVGPVLMEFLVTGPRKAVGKAPEDHSDALADGEIEDDDVAVMSPGAPLKYQWNPLIRAWRDNYGNVSWRYKMPDPQNLERMPTMAKWLDPDYGKKKDKRPYEPRSFAVWECMPVKEWFEKMAAREVFPQWCDPFERMFVSRKYNRMPFELKEWQQQAAMQERSIKSALSVLNEPLHSSELKTSVMNGVFPKYRHSCEYPTPCPFKQICWEGITDPLSAGFKYRVANHPEVLPQ